MIFFLVLGSLYVIAYENLVIPDHDRPPIQVQLPRTGSTVPVGPPCIIRVERDAVCCETFRGTPEGLAVHLRRRYGSAFSSRPYILTVTPDIPMGRLITIMESLRRSGLRHLALRGSGGR